jgi:glycerone phosphate O-acyltransferase
MFATCLECLFKGRVSDVYVVPISVTYERLLEEQLYANELLGIPKPKETISGLMKARSIISQSYGTIIINFSQPISMHEWLYQDKFHLNRLTNVMTPRFIFQITPDESKAIEACSYDILEKISSGQVIQPISLICTSLLQNSCNCEMSVDELLNEFKYLQKLFSNLSITTYMPIVYHDTDESNSLEILKLFFDNFKMHSNLFDFGLTGVLGNQRAQVNLDTLELSEFLGLNKTMLFVRIKTIGLKKTTVNRTDLFQNASTYLCVCSYRNQLVNFLISYSILLISLIRTSGKAANIMDAYKSFAYLVDLYDHEFLFNKSNLSQTFDTLLNYSKALNLIDESLHLVAFSLHSQHTQWFLMSLIKPYLYNYLAIYKLILANNLSEYVDDKAFLQQLQTLLFDEILLHTDNTDITLESLSLNLIQNSLSSLGIFGILRKSKVDTNAKTFRYALDLSRLQVLANHLTGLCESLKCALDSMSSDSSTNTPLSKL